MATKPLKSIKFPGLADTYTVTQLDDAAGGMGTQGKAPDSKAVKDAVDELKEDLNDLRSGIIALYDKELWEVGGLYPSYGGEADSTTRLRTGYISSNIKVINPLNSYKYMILAYNATSYSYIGVWNGSGFQLSGNWLTTETAINETLAQYALRLILATSEDATVTTDDAENLELYVYTNVKLPDNVVTIDALSHNLSNNVVRGEYTEQAISWGSSNQYINCNTGVITDAGDNWNVHVSDYIDCGDLKSIRYTGSPIYTFACVAFYDANKKFIRSYPATSSTVNYWMEEITVPDTAKYVVFGNNSGESGRLSVKVEYMSNYGVKCFRPWINKKWACVGDSLTEINSRASMRYMDYIQIKTGIKPYNMGVSGTGYANGHANNKAFVDRIINVPTDSDVVTIFGSNNDMFGDNLPVGDITDSGTSTLCGFINNTIDALYTTFPQAVLGIITPCPWENIYPSANTELGQKGIAYSKALVDICAYRGIPCLDLFHCSGMRPWEASYRTLFYKGDEGGGVHPDADGHKILASHIKAFLETLII